LLYSTFSAGGGNCSLENIASDIGDRSRDWALDLRQIDDSAPQPRAAWEQIRSTLDGCVPSPFA
jgi:hypothetical protein